MNIKKATAKLNDEIDEKRFIRSELGNPEDTSDRGEEWRYFCPFHNDKPNPALDYNVKKGTYYCRSCGAGGSKFQFFKEYHHLSDEEAVEEMAEIYGVPVNGKKSTRLKLKTYAKQKGLDLEKLKSYGLKNGKNGIKIPYKDTAGKEVALRTRKKLHKPINGDDNRFYWRKGDKTTLYGLWQLEDFRKDRIILVEGESDSHTLWQHNIPAFGFPGKATFKEEWLKYLEDFDTVVILEEDGARRQILDVAQRTWKNLDVEVEALNLPTDDVNDFYLEGKEYFKERLDKELQNTEALDFNEPELQIEQRCRTQRNLRHNNTSFKVNFPYLVDEELYQFKTYQNKGPRKIKVANFPIYLGGRFRDEVNQSLWTEVVWRTANGKESKLLPRGRALDSYQNGIRQLADFGAPVHTQNTSDVVKFLDNFEKWNQEALEPKRGSSQLGWIREGEPVFLLGKDSIGGDCKFIPHGPEEERLAEHYEPRGDKENWINLWDNLENPQSRIVVSSLLASPLLRLLGQRSALFYLYGESGIGKTAALWLGLSAWGNPEKLKATAYSTTVGMERRAALLNDLPLAIDERQAATSDSFIERLVYMLSGGQSKSRGKKEGGLEKVRSWRSLALMTGEEDLTGSQWTGIENRTLQLHASELLSEDLSQTIYEVASDNYGQIGRDYIELVTDKGSYEVKKIYTTIKNEIDHIDLSRAKLSIIGAVGTAEYLLLDSLERSTDLAIQDSENLAAKLGRDTTKSLAERARDFLFSRFSEFRAELDHRDPGKIDNRAFIDREESDEAGELWIMSSVFKQWIQEGGFTVKRVKKDFANKDWIKAEEKNGKTRYTTRKQVNGIRNRYIVVDLEEAQREPETEKIPF